MNETKLFAKRVFFVIILLSLLLGGCAPQMSAKSVAATEAPKSTATTAPTNTPAPTNTSEPTATATATATATLKPTLTATPNRTATVAAKETAYAKDILKRIEPDLTTYGFTLADGHLLWSYPNAMDIEVKEYGMSRFVNIDAPRASNFILQTRITWNTTGGLAGCGLFFRMEDGTSETRSNQFIMYRLKSAPAWDISFYDRSQWQRSISSWVYSKSINDENDATNIVTLVVNGRNIYPYINGKKQKLVEDITLKDGLFAISATQESGVSTCTFRDTWIWAIDKK